MHLSTKIFFWSVLSNIRKSKAGIHFNDAEWQDNDKRDGDVPLQLSGLAPSASEMVRAL